MNVLDDAIEEHERLLTMFANQADKARPLKVLEESELAIVSVARWIWESDVCGYRSSFCRRERGPYNQILFGQFFPDSVSFFRSFTATLRHEHPNLLPSNRIGDRDLTTIMKSDECEVLVSLWDTLTHEEKIDQTYSVLHDRLMILKAIREVRPAAAGKPGKEWSRVMSKSEIMDILGYDSYHMFNTYIKTEGIQIDEISRKSFRICLDRLPEPKRDELA